MVATLSIKNNWLLIVILAWCVTETAWAQEQVFVIKAARVIDGVRPTVIENGVVIVRGGRIEAIGPVTQIRVPPGAGMVELPDHTVLPGLIDMHDHPTVRADEGGQNGAVEAWLEHDTKQMARAVRNLRVSLLSGITTLRSVGENRGNDLILAQAVRDGVIPGPRIIPSDTPIAATGNPAPFRWIDGPDQIRKRVRELAARGAQFINLYLNDTSPKATDYTPEEVCAAVNEAHRHGLRVTVHVSGRWGAAIRLALACGADSFEHPQPINDETIELFLKHKTYLYIVPTLFTLTVQSSKAWWRKLDTEMTSIEGWLSFNRKLIEQARRANPRLETDEALYGIKPYQASLLRAFRRGVPISPGTEGAHGTLQLGIEYLVEAGFTPMQAIQAATRVAAQGSGWGERIGTLEPGKLADIIAVEGDPLQRISDLGKVRFIMIEGRRYDGLSFH